MDFYESGEFRSTANWPYAISAGSVVYRPAAEASIEALLLIRKAGEFPRFQYNFADSYNLPKGHVGLGETLEAASKRETNEEAGVEIELKTYLGQLHMKFADGDIMRDKTVHYFAGEWTKDRDEIDDEHSATAWYQIDEAKRLLSKIGDHDNPKKEWLIIERLEKYLNMVERFGSKGEK